MAGVVEIGFCDAGRYRPLMEFVRRHWKPGHILGQNKELLDWQYLDDRRSRYNFVAGFDTAGGHVLGLLGFIPTSRFDAGLSASDTIWFALWKADSMGVPLLGLRLYRYLSENLEFDVLSCIGFNSEANTIYESLGFTVGELQQYYMRNEGMTRFVLLSGRGEAEMASPSRMSSADATLRRVLPDEYWRYAKALQWSQSTDVYPKKSLEYFYTRYFDHPFYDYAIRFIARDAKPVGLLVTRTIEHRGARAIRIVDYHGPEDALSGLRPAFQALLSTDGAEYIDFYSHGIGQEAMASAGFVWRKNVDDVIVPNHYEPFVQRNATIRFAYKSAVSGCRFTACKGDGDQDRPNIVPVA